MDDTITSPPPHVIIFPSPIQWPVNTMFDIAELLCLSGLNVTLLLTPFTHNLLLHHFHLESRLNPYPIIRHVESPSTRRPIIRLHTISDGIPPDHPRSDATELLDSMETFTKPAFKNLLSSFNSDDCGPVSCIISDGFMTFVYDVADDIQIPVISALSSSPCSLWALSNLPDPTVAGAGEVGADSARKRVTGIDGILTSDDLASMCRARDLTPKHFRKQIEELSRAHGLILNTFKALDGPMLSLIGSIGPKLYPIGPIHAHLGVRQEAEGMTPLLNYSVEENNNCIMWLDTQQPKSVVYVNIENQAQIEWAQTLELWHGLVGSRKRFLWVRKPETVVGDGRVPPNIVKGTKERGCIVDSASNVHVLGHKAIGGFLTDGEWESVIQGVVEGVPIMCCPSSLDREVNSKFVSKAWRIGFDFEWRWERRVIEKMIRDAMGLKNDLSENANKLKILGRKSVRKGGSSYVALDHLIDDIVFMHNGL